MRTGSTTDVRGLSLLEAAAVGGETLAVDALANAIGPVFRARRSADRVAVAMSGGVDSAVALLRAGPRGDWRDAAALGRPGGERDRQGVLLSGLGASPRGRPATDSACRTSRSTCARSSVARSSSRSSVATRGARRRTRARAATAAFASQSCSRSLVAPAPHGSPRGTTHGSASTAAASCSPAPPTSGRTSRTCSPASTPQGSTGSGSRSGTRGKTETRAQAAAAGLAAAERAESQEACFLAGDDYRLFLERRGLPVTPGPIVDERGAVVGEHRGHWRYTPGPAPRAGHRRRAAALRDPTRAATNTVVVGPARVARPHRDLRPRAPPRSPSPRAEVKVRYRSAAVAARSCDRARVPPRPRRAGLRGRAGADRGSLRGRRRRRGRRRSPKIARWLRHSTGATSPISR